MNRTTGMNKKSKNLLIWGTGGCLFLGYMVVMANRAFVSTVGGSDDVWCQMWCYLMAAIAGLLMPWLIARRKVWSTITGTILGLLAAIALGLVGSETFGNYHAYGILSDTIGTGFLWAGVVAFLLAGALPCMFPARGSTTVTERRVLYKTGRILLSIAGGFILFGIMIMGGLMIAMDRYDLRWWEILLLIPLNIVPFTLFAWFIGELLPPGRWRRYCFRAFLGFLLPGLVATALAYFLELHNLWFILRLLAALLPLGIGGLLVCYLRRELITPTISDKAEPNNTPAARGNNHPPSASISS